jgi:predicted phage terminase large subunit-like protein
MVIEAMGSPTGLGQRRRTPTPDAAKAERAKRELARRKFMHYCQYVADWYKPARHHFLVGETLEKVKLFIATKGAEGIGRVIVNEPPRMGKTEEAARLFPSWVLGCLPDSRVIVASYGADLAEEDSRSIRNYVTSKEFGNVFGQKSALSLPVGLSEDSRSKADWNLAAPFRGGVNAAGIGGGLTGLGAHLLIIDDPFKSREDAESESYRRKVMNWYRSVAYQRLEKGGAIVIMHTRWHPDDLVGQLLQLMGSDDPFADQWEVLFLPAIALEKNEYPQNEIQFRENLVRGIFIPYEDPLHRQPGEVLWPEKFTKEDLERKKANTDDQEFSSLDQQLPRPQSGNFFDEKNIIIRESAPELLQWFAYMDLALGESKQSDLNAVMLMALDASNGDLWGRDLLQVRDLDEFIKDVAELMLLEKNKGVIWGVEDVAFQSRVFKDFTKQPRLANIAILRVKPDGDKVTRARPVRTRSLSGNFKLVRGPWNITAIRQLLAFPNGKHDDVVDTVSGGTQMIAESANRIRRKASQHDG